MSGSLVFITPHLSFDALKNREVSYPDAYKIQIQDWLLKPVDVLSRDETTKAANGMAAFAVLLLFFEPHGQYLTGDDSFKKSKRCFIKAFDSFLEFLTREEKGTAPSSESIYTWARCGLFHSTKLDNNILVDTISCGKGIFTKMILPAKMAKRSKEVYLVNPWRMRIHLERYVGNYCSIIMTKRNKSMTKMFHVTFNRLLGGPMKYFCS